MTRCSRAPRLRATARRGVSSTRGADRRTPTARNTRARLARHAPAPWRNRVRPTAAPPRALHRSLPGTLPQSTLWSWSWNRTGSRSARIQSASCRAGNCSALGENNTVAARGELQRLQLVAAPLVVGAIADHELDLLLGPQQREFVVAIAALLAASPASSRPPRGSRAHRRRPAASRRWSRATRGSRRRKARSAAAGSSSAPAARRR